MKFLAVLGVLLVVSIPAAAGVVTFTSSSAFQASTSITNAEDFEGFTQGFLTNPFTTHGIRFEQLPGGHPNVIPYISNAGNLGNAFEPTSKTLDGNGDENFLIQLASGASFTAIGFDVVTNQDGAPVVSLYDVSSALIGSYTLTQAPNTLGFFGATSTTPIGSVTFIVDRGWQENTALDNIAIGTATPEPASGAIFAAALAVLAGLRRRSCS